MKKTGWTLSMQLLTFMAAAVPAVSSAAETLEGQVLGAGLPIAQSTVTLWGGSESAPKQLARATTGDDGRFSLALSLPGDATTLYLVAKGASLPPTRKARPILQSR